ncbi:MAG TPA: hypothetical protein VF209_03445 [Patescibacteria group bacterium]
MKNKYHFFHYGKKVDVHTDSNFFQHLIDQKFSQFKADATYPLVAGECQIKWVTSSPPPLSDIVILSSMAQRSSTTLRITHSYLTTTTTIDFDFASSTSLTCTQITLYYQESLLFTLAAFGFSFLRRQLFQVLIKKYIEQSLLWLLVQEKKLICLHAAAVEKEGRVVVLAGLNGVGKSTLASKYISNQSFSYFGDNYLLLDTKNAYYSPDVVRLDQQSLTHLQLTSQTEYGFGKKVIAPLKKSPLHRAPVKAIAWTQRGSIGHKKRMSAQEFWQMLEHYQILEGEAISAAPISYWQPGFSSSSKYPSVPTYVLTLGPFGSQELPPL